MTRQEWRQSLKAVMKLWSADDYQAALTGLNRLSRKTRKAIKTGVTEWDELELLGLRASLLEESGNRKASVKQFLARAKLARGYLSQYGHTVATSLEFAGSSDARQGNRQTAVRVFEELLRLRSAFPDANIAFEDVVRAVREVRDDRNRRLGQKRSRQGEP